MWEHCGHCSSCTQGPQLNNEEKIILRWNNAQCAVGGAQVGLPGSHEAVIMLSLGACQGV